MSYTVVHRDDLPHDENSYEFQGLHHQTNVSFIWVDMLPGGTIRLHKHPYEEIFIIQEGVATFTVGSVTLDAYPGQVIVVPAEVPHQFANRSDKPLKQVDIHVSEQFVTDWLEDDI